MQEKLEKVCAYSLWWGEYASAGGEWSPSEIGKNEIRAETTQITKIVRGTDFRVNHSVYCKGSFMWIYLQKNIKALLHAQSKYPVLQ